jgi:hypothetical protein
MRGECLGLRLRVIDPETLDHCTIITAPVNAKRFMHMASHTSSCRMEVRDLSPMALGGSIIDSCLAEMLFVASSPARMQWRAVRIVRDMHICAALLFDLSLLSHLMFGGLSDISNLTTFEPILICQPTSLTQRVSLVNLEQAD